MLRSDDRLNDVGEIVDVRKGFDTEEDVVEGGLLVRGVFRALDDCEGVSCVLRGKTLRDVPNLGLNRSFP
jgi:hypothetical protein